MIQESIERLTEIEIPDNPFPGLRPFELHESLLFFGRESQNERLIEKLGRTRFLAIVGTSGSGKSSLVRAGLLPALLGGMMPDTGSVWHIALMRPGNNPIGNLASALNSHDAFGFADEENRNLQIAITEATLRRGNLGLVEAVRQANQPANENLLVIADQIEELFRVEQGAQNEELANDKAAFVKLLLEAGRQRKVNIYVVLTMRSDYLGECSQFQDLPEAINESQYLIPRLTRDQLRQTITGPVAVGGAVMTPRLVNQLLNDIGDQQDQLPILQHAMMRMWDEWKNPKHRHEGEAIDVCCYDAIGRMVNALSVHANEIYDELCSKDPSLGKVLEDVFKALTKTTLEGNQIRNPLNLDKLCDIAGKDKTKVIGVIEAFRQEGRSFLVPYAPKQWEGEVLIDISHESLIRKWDKLIEWVKKDAENAGHFRRLVEDSLAFNEGESSLWDENDLKSIDSFWEDITLPWAQKYGGHFEEVQSFIKQCKDEKAAVALYRELKKRANAYYESKGSLLGTADYNYFTQKLMENRPLLVLAEKYGGEKYFEEWEQLKIYLEKSDVQIKEEGKRQNEEEAKRASELMKAAERKAKDQKERADAEVAKQIKTEVREIPEHQRAKFEANRAELERKSNGKFKTHTNGIFIVIIIASVFVATTYAYVFNEARKKAELVVKRLERYRDDMDKAYQAYDKGHFKELQDLLHSYFPNEEQPQSDLRGLEWRSLWRLSHDEEFTLIDHVGAVRAVAFSNKKLATAGDDRKINIYEVSGGAKPIKIKTLGESSGHKELGAIKSLASSPTSDLLLSWGDSPISNDNKVFQWHVNGDASQEPSKFKRWVGQAYTVAFANDEKTWTAVGNVASVNIGGDDKILFTKHLGSVFAAGYAPNGGRLASGGEDKTIKLWKKIGEDRWQYDQDLTAPGKEFAHTDTVLCVVFSPDGRYLASGSSDKRVRLWDMKNNKLIQSFESHRGAVTSVAFSPDSKTLASGSEDCTVKLWKVRRENGGATESSTLKGHGNKITSVVFVDNNRIVTGSEDETVKIWGLNQKDKTTDISADNSVQIWKPANDKDIEQQRNRR